MEKREELYRGKAKSVYTTDDADRLILLFRNDTSAFDGKRIEQLDRKGMVNNKFNAFIMQKLEEAGVPTQFDKLLGDNECLVKKLDMIPVECVVRNYAAGSLVKRLGVEEGMKLNTYGMPLDDAQFIESKKFQANEIARLFRVPPHKIGILDNATFSNIEQQQIQAVQDLFLPWCKRWEEAFAGALLLPAEQDNHYWKHNLNGLLRGDAAARFSAYSTGLQNGIYSINEVRGYEDLDPIEGGDTHVRQLNMADILATAAAPATMEPAV